MAGHAGEGIVLFVKKLGGLISIVFGFLLTAGGIELNSVGVTILGVLFLALGAILLTLKIMRRNQSRQAG
jgi:hypothetical protein